MAYFARSIQGGPRRRDGVEYGTDWLEYTGDVPEAVAADPRIETATDGEALLVTIASKVFGVTLVLGDAVSVDSSVAFKTA